MAQQQRIQLGTVRLRFAPRPCSVGWDLELRWLWRRPAAAAPIQPLAWEPPRAAGAALKSKNPPENTKTLRGDPVVTE